MFKDKISIIRFLKSSVLFTTLTNPPSPLTIIFFKYRFNFSVVIVHRDTPIIVVFKFFEIIEFRGYDGPP